MSTINTDDPPIVKRRKTKIRRNKKRINDLGLDKSKMSKKKKKTVVKKKVEATEVVKIICSERVNGNS